MNRSFIKLSAAQQLARQLRRQIEQGDWHKGHSLPPMRDLAEEYGVSLSTVQKAVRELASLDVIDHSPGQSGVVKSIRPPASHHQIAWVEGFDPDARSDAWGEAIMRGARGLLAAAGFRLTLITYNFKQPDFFAQVMRLLEPIADQLAGLYCPALPPLLPVIEYAQRKGLPWMTVTPTRPSITHNFVAADNLGGGRMAGRCFAQLGLRRLVMLHLGMDAISPQEKAGGLCLGYLEKGLPPPAIDLVQCRNQEESAGHEAMRDYLNHHDAPEGVFTTGDFLAIGALRAAQEAGLQVPRDLSVIGSTGIPPDQLHFSPTLAAVAQPMREMGEQIGAGLVQMIREGVRQLAPRRIPCHFIPGQSLNIPEPIQRDWAAGQSDQAMEPDQTVNVPLQEVSHESVLA
jgi:DNA-binding LacI/PurR family transcriptional regulator